VPDGGSGVSGDFAGLAGLRAHFVALANGSFMRSLRIDLAEEAAAQIGASFNEQRDPYGVPWAPRKKPGDGHPLLRYTDAMYNSLRTRATATGIRVTSPLPYVAAHQKGATGHYDNAHGDHNRFVRQRRSQGRRDPYTALGAVRVSIGEYTIPARPFLPDEARGMGPLWQAGFELRAERALRLHFGL
jgi:phage gpG-like protein